MYQTRNVLFFVEICLVEGRLQQQCLGVHFQKRMDCGEGAECTSIPKLRAMLETNFHFCGIFYDVLVNDNEQLQKQSSMFSNIIHRS